MSLSLIMFAEFFKIGLFAVGGGLATLPFLFELTQKYDWFTMTELTNMIAVSESSPGPIGVNMATYVGFSSMGIWGSVLATIALILPSLIVCLIVSKILDKFRKNKIVENIFSGLRPAVVGMLAASIISVYAQNFIGDVEALISFVFLKKVVIYLLLVFALFKFKKHPILYIGLGAFMGILAGI